MRIPISFKLITLTISFLIVTTAFFVAKSTALLGETLTDRENEANMNEAKAQANEVINILNSARERSEIIGALLIKSSGTRKVDFTEPKEEKSLNEIEFNFNKDQNLAAIEVYKFSPTGVELVARKVKTDLKTDYKIDLPFIEKLRRIQQFPLRNLSAKSFEVRNSVLPNGLPLISLGFPLAVDENKNVVFAAIADIQLHVVQKVFAKESSRVSFMVDRVGTLLGHKDEAKVLARLSFKNHPVVEKAVSDTNSSRQISYTDPESESAHIGAYVKNIQWGITVISSTDKNIVLSPSVAIRNEAIYNAGRVISAALFLIFLFSMTLTSPIEKLAEMIAHVSKGNFDIKARSVVKTNDEVGDLAVAFDNMTEGLKERDKVKNLFSKFHGSSVAEDLLKNDIGVGGTKKNVTVFFSDIRGFTAFSEGHTPEEVVTMLNEYFEVMVGIINKNKGVVDKFIGDAIMAVWGAPKSDARDTQHALLACIEMRSALWELNKKRETRGQIPIKIGMGLHAGPAISGTIGSTERMEYTVIGDTVNMTSRIESSTKAFGTDLLISEDIAKKVGDEFLIELAGSAEVKGKAEPLKMFKVRGYKKNNGEVVEVKTPFSDYEAEAAEKVKVA